MACSILGQHLSLDNPYLLGTQIHVVLLLPPLALLLLSGSTWKSLIDFKNLKTLCQAKQTQLLCQSESQGTES